MNPIRESGVDFGPYEDENLFHIEKSRLYKSLGEGLKIVEFVLRINTNIIFVEAKTNAPNPENRDISMKNQKKFEQFYTEVPDKFVNSFGVYTAALLKRYADTLEIGTNLQNPDLKGMKIIFATIITNPDAKIEWLAPIKAVLEDRLRRWLKIWDINVVVYNRELADKFGLTKASKN